MSYVCIETRLAILYIVRTLIQSYIYLHPTTYAISKDKSQLNRIQCQSQAARISKSPSPTSINNRTKPHILRAGKIFSVRPMSSTISWKVILEEINITLLSSYHLIHNHPKLSDIYACRIPIIIRMSELQKYRRGVFMATLSCRITTAEPPQSSTCSW